MLTALALASMLPVAHAQKMPSEYYFSDDGHILYIGKANTAGFYNMDTIQQIRITFPQSDFVSQLTNNYTPMTYLIGNMTINGQAKDSVGVRYKGFTSYSLVQGNKKSFDVDLNIIKPTQDIGGYTKLNLHNSYQDPSFMREVFYYHNIRRYSISAKANFVQLHINGSNYGLYQNVQQYNKDFLDEWFLTNDGSNWRGDKPSTTNSGLTGPIQWGDGNSAFNYKGEDTTAYKAFYDLKSSDQPQPWKDLPTVCRILNQSSEATLEADVAPYLDIDRVLWHLAGEVLFGDDDSYVYKGKMDYYLYQDAETGRFISYDYDANSTCAPAHYNWSPFYNENNANFPLMNKLLKVPSIRQRYLAHMRTMLNESFDPTKSAAIIDKYKALIDATVSADPIKLSTYNQFNSGITALKKFITDRRAYLLAHSEFNQTAPVITNTAPYLGNTAWPTPTESESVVVTSNVSHSNGISKVYLYYGTGIYGKFTKLEMYDDGQHGDGNGGDGKYGATIPPQSGNTQVRFYVEAVANNAAKTASYAPVGAEHDVYTYKVKVTVIGAANSPLVINEFLASNISGAKDEAGQYEDWIELHNKTSQAIDLSGYYLTDNSNWLQKWQFPQGVSIAANGYLIVWADEDQSQGKTHANFKLSVDGEDIVLLNRNVQILDSISYGKQFTSVSFARIPNATGPFMHRTVNTFAARNDDVTSIDKVLDIQTNEIMIMPNPATSELRIIRSELDEIPVRILSSNGFLMYENSMNSSLNIDVSSWTSGIYIIKCGNKVSKFAKK